MKHIRAWYNQVVLGLAFGCLLATAGWYVVGWGPGLYFCGSLCLVFCTVGILKCFGRLY